MPHEKCWGRLVDRYCDIGPPYVDQVRSEDGGAGRVSGRSDQERLRKLLLLPLDDTSRWNVLCLADVLLRWTTSALQSD